jgi:hypothetical protein
LRDSGRLLAWRRRRWDERGNTNVYRIHIAFVGRVHVSVWEKTIGEERKKNKLRKCEKLISREGESRSSIRLSESDIEFSLTGDFSIPQV